jgi:hypothetical protein
VVVRRSSAKTAAVGSEVAERRCIRVISARVSGHRGGGEEAGPGRSSWRAAAGRLALRVHVGVPPVVARVGLEEKVWARSGLLRVHSGPSGPQSGQRLGLLLELDVCLELATSLASSSALCRWRGRLMSLAESKVEDGPGSRPCGVLEATDLRQHGGGAVVIPVRDFLDIVVRVG